MEPCEPGLLLSRYAQSGCQEAFAILVQRYRGLVYGAAVRRLNGDAAAAEDVVQKVFAELASEAIRFKGDSQLGGWLYRRAIRFAADAQKADRRRRVREAKAVETDALNTSSEEGRVDIVAAVEEALACLPRSDRDILVLRFLEERSLRVVGESLGLTEDAAQKRVARALERLRDLLRSRGLGATMSVVLSVLGGLAAAPSGLAALAGMPAAPPVACRAGSSLLFHTTMNAKPLAAAAAAILLVVGVAIPWIRSSREAADAQASAGAPAKPAPALASVRPPKPPAAGLGTAEDGSQRTTAAAPVSPDGSVTEQSLPAPEQTMRQRVEAVTLQRYEEKMQRLQRKLNLTPDQMEKLSAHHLAQREKWIDYLTGAAENRADPRLYSLEAGYREDVPPALQAMLSADQLDLYRAYDTNKRTNHIEAVTSGEINYLAQRLDLDPASKDALFSQLSEINQIDLFEDLAGVADLQSLAKQADRDVARRRAAFGQVLDPHQMGVWESVVTDYRRELLKRFGSQDQTAGEPRGASSGQSS